MSESLSKMDVEVGKPLLFDVLPLEISCSVASTVVFGRTKASKKG